MSTITLTPITSGFNLVYINNNFDTIETSINTDVVHLAGGNNTMGQDLDLNGYNLSNVDSIQANSFSIGGTDITTALNTAVTNAQNSATAAAASATSASGYATTASGYATTASGYATDASNDATLAYKWANNPVNVAVSGGEYSAYHWAQQAQAYATGQLTYRGAWDASGGTYPSSPSLGDFYKISVAGTISSVDYAIGDNIIYNGSGWDKIDNSEIVTSVAGKIGDVTLSTSDISGLSSALSGKADLTGASFTGAISATNLSGTNTGDQDLSGYALLTGATFTGAITTPSITINGGKTITKISLGTSTPGSLADGELYLQY